MANVDALTGMFEGEPTYFLKLTNGDSIIGISNDDPDKINEAGCFVMRDIMKLRPQLTANNAGEIIEMLLIQPWMEGAEIDTEISIPIDAIVAITVCKESMAEKYRRQVVALIIRKAVSDAQRALDEMGIETDRQPPVTDDAPNDKADIKFIQPNVKPRTPELLTREKMMESEMAGELDDPLPDDSEDQNENPADLPYQIDGITYH